MKALLDVNLLLDVVLARQPWAAAAQAICDACSEARLGGYVAAATVPTLFYIVRHHADVVKANEAVRICLESFDILPVDRAALELARTLPANDFEDNLQIACAFLGGMDWIVTRDKGLFHPDIRVLDPDNALNSL